MADLVQHPTAQALVARALGGRPRAGASLRPRRTPFGFRLYALYAGGLALHKTFSSVEEAAFQAIRVASEIIDMRKHKGTHARLGATDVCPIIPISEISIKECIELSENLAKRVGEELNIPVFLYEKSFL